AAVAGTEFDVELVLAVADATEWSEQLASCGLVSAVSDGRAAFRHALTRDAAYAAVPWSRRRALHRAIAGHLADGHAPPALIAGHLLAARDLAAARAALIAAAEAAAVAFATAGRPAEAAVERLAAASHLRSAASFAAALDTLVAARSDADAAGRADLLLRIDGLYGNVLARMGRAREGIAAVRAALDAALAQALTGPAAELHQRLADSLEHAGEYRTAIATYAAGYEFCQAHGEQAA